MRRNGNAQKTVSGLEVATEGPGPVGPLEGSPAQTQTAETQDSESPSVPEHRSFLRDLRFQDWLVLLGLLTILAALLVGESRDAEFAKFLANRPLLSGFLLASLFALIALGGLDALRAHLEAERWRNLSSLAVLSIAHDITMVIDTFIWLVIGVKPRGSFEPSDSAQEELTDIRALEDLDQTDDADYNHVQYGKYSEILEKLVGNAKWRTLANLQIDGVKAGHRRSIALWVPSMMLDPNTTEVLSRVAGLNDFMSHIQKNLRNHQDSSGPKSQDLVDSWMKFLAEATSLREDLWAISRGRPKKPPSSRNVLPDEIQMEMELRDKEPVRDVVARPLRVAGGQPARTPSYLRRIMGAFRRRPPADPPSGRARQD